MECKTFVFIFTYVAEEVFEVVASGIVVGIQNSCVHVLLLMVSLPVVELLMTVVLLMQSFKLIQNICNLCLYLYFFSQLTHLAGPGVAQNSSHIHWGVCHDGVVVEFFLGLVSVFKL